MLAGLLWCISPASVSDWTLLQNQWNSKHPLWVFTGLTWTDIYLGATQWYDLLKPLSSYSIWDGSGWLTAEAVDLAEPAPLCIENCKRQAQVGCTLTNLCQTHILGHCWKVQNDAWAAVATGTLWVGDPHEWPYLYGNWTGHCT